jgi:hypothetical protein
VAGLPMRGSDVGKKTITQRNFLLGSMREGFLEADDLDIRQMSCRDAGNMRVTATRGLRSRPGLIWIMFAPGAYDIVEIRPSTGLIYGFVIEQSSAKIILEDGSEDFSIPSAPWSSPEDVWVETFREKTIVGGPFGLYELTYDAGAWSFGPFVFNAASGGDIAQPYWSFVKDTTIKPSATTGSISILASKALWTADYVGMKIRYGQREMTITSYASPTLVYATVSSILPPSFRIVLSRTKGFNTGDVLVGSDTNYQGVIVNIAGSTIEVATTSFFDGPDTGENLSTASGTASVTSKAEISPLASYIWDEPVMSPVRGYPRAGASAAGRLALVDFPLVPDLICMSSSRNVNDFEAGGDDDDAIVRTTGDNSPRFMHVVNAGDLLLFSDRGLYYISLRDGGILTPQNFKVTLFDKRSSSPVRPVAVDDGVVFVEASGEAIGACLLDGNIYLKWSVRTISTYHNHLIKSPIKLCGPSLFSEATEKYMFVINSDGTIAAVSWFSDFAADSVGFVEWTTQGDFKTASPAFGGYWVAVDRVINGTTQRVLERFDDAAMVDCSVPVFTSADMEVNGVNLTVNGGNLSVRSAGSTPLANTEVHIHSGTWYGGTRTVAGDGTVPNLEDMPISTLAGFNFVSNVMPWPVEVIESPRAGMLSARLIRGSVSVLASTSFQIRANTKTRNVGGYKWGESLEQAPPLRTEVYRFSVTGRRDHPEIEIIKPLPGILELMAVTQEVQY